MLSLFQILGNFWLILFIFIQMLILIGFFIPEKTKKNKKQIPVSVIIAAWNEGPRIEKCINSILRQNYKKNIEIIVIGGGTDNTVEVCKKLSKKGKIKYILENRRRGKWFSLNKGVEKAKYKILAFIDGDCFLDKNWFKNMVSRINDYDLVVSYQTPAAERTSICKMYSILSLFAHNTIKNISKFLGISVFFGFGSLIKRTVFKKIKFGKSLVEDWKFSREFIKGGLKIGFVSNAITYHSIAKTLFDLRKEFLRGFYGLNLEIIQKKDFLSIVFLILYLVFIISIPFYVYNIIIGDFFTLVITGVSLAALIICVFIYLMQQKKSRLVFYIPYLLFVFIFCFLINMESILRLIFRKKYGWPLINKIS